MNSLAFNRSIHIELCLKQVKCLSNVLNYTHVNSVNAYILNVNLCKVNSLAIISIMFKMSEMSTSKVLNNAHMNSVYAYIFHLSIYVMSFILAFNGSILIGLLFKTSELSISNVLTHTYMF